MCELLVEEGCFFQDGIRTVDFVIVLKGESLDPLAIYIRHLEEMGVEFEVAKGQIVQKDFLLIHLPYKTLKHFAEVYHVGMEERKAGFERQGPEFTYSYSTPISFIPHKQKGTFTNTERITVLSKLLENARYGDDVNQRGLSKLIRAKLIEDAYPLHDGPIDNDLLEYTNDRQLLFHYWSNLSMWYKEMPLDMIKQYFGCEIAFYFAWLEFFNFMLIPAAILGTLITIINVIVLLSFRINPVQEVCEANNMVVCPSREVGKYCFEKLASFCVFVKLNYIFDNYLGVGFAIFMSFWAIFFIKWWKRKENSLKFRWDVQYQNPVLNSRQELIYSTKKSKPNLAIVEEEPVVPIYITALRLIVSVCVSLFMFSLALAGIFGVVVYELTIAMLIDISKSCFVKERGKVITLAIAAIIQMVFIQLFSLVYRKLCTCLIIFQNSKTELGYDNSFLYKRYLLSFANNYGIFFYIAFIKGSIFTIPNNFGYFPILERDTCQPLTCIIGLSIMLLVYLLLKRFAEGIITYLIPNCKGCAFKLNAKKYDPSKIPQYEEEYGLATDRFLLVNRFCDMVTEYGLVTFFVAALPLAPMCILLNNLLDIRMHAYQLVTRYRRPVPKRTDGIGAWNGILLGLTYLSTAINAFVIAFTSDFVARELYESKVDPHLKGYINSTLSIYSVKDSFHIRNMKSYPDICFYRGKRYPPDHRKRYQLTKDYWIELMWKLIFVIIFEHVLLLCNGIISYTISDISQGLRKKQTIDRELAKEARKLDAHNYNRQTTGGRSKKKT